MHRSLPLCFGLIGLALCAPAMRAQDAAPAQSGSGSTQPAQPAAQQQPDQQPAPKKVWTNADVPTLRADSDISTVGPRRQGQNSGSADGRQPVQPGKNANAKWYGDQITRLQSKLPPINDKIAQLQAGIDGKFTGDGKTSSRPKYGDFGDWKDQLAQLQKQRDDIQDKIDALRDQARRAGVPPNQLP